MAITRYDQTAPSHPVAYTRIETDAAVTITTDWTEVGNFQLADRSGDFSFSLNNTGATDLSECQVRIKSGENDDWQLLVQNADFTDGHPSVERASSTAPHLTAAGGRSFARILCGDAWAAQIRCKVAASTTTVTLSGVI